MFADERRASILLHLEENQRMTVSDLARLHDTSESTIRRDLQELEEQGHLKRTHGGAIAIDSAAFEPSWQEKNVQNANEKALIGQLAASLVSDGQTIILDAGTTTIQIARFLKARNVNVVTNGLNIANELAGNPNVNLIALGGEFRPTTGAFVGPFTESLLRQLHVDFLFLGANGFDERGVTTPNAVEAATKRGMMAAAEHVVLVSDATKLGQVSFVQVCDWGRINTFITDRPIVSTALSAELRTKHVKVCVAETNENC